jgi:addiction module HigA family antidote
MAMVNAPHPGELLKKLYLEPLDLTVGKVADGLSVTRPMMSRIINGHAGISPDMALRLAKAFDTTPEFWINAQSNYDLDQAKSNAKKIKIKRLYKAA